MNDLKSTFQKFFNEQLNEPQQQAVEPRDGVLLVIAGAGSGKTRVITSRIINLIIHYDVDPTSIVALTFTNKAANEMKDRVKRFLPQGSILPYIGTFHSYCLYLLKRNAHLLEHPEFSILDAEDQEKLIKTIIKRHGLEKQVTPKNVLYSISSIKNSLSLHTGALHDFSKNQLLMDLYQTYEKEKQQSKCFDFDDLLVKVHQLFEKNEEFKTQHQEKIRHILIDEYQDTNVIQHALLKHCALNKKKLVVDSVCAVGDEDQSIYSWRGATVTNILNFKKDFPTAMVVTIEQNYRSAEPILQVANSVIENNINRNPKNLWSAKKATDRVRVMRCLSGYQEGEAIVQMIEAAMNTHSTRPKASLRVPGELDAAPSGILSEHEMRVEGQKRLKNFALLYRAHHQSRMLEESLIRASIPYKIIGGIQFYERKEIKDMLAYLRLIVNPFDRMALFRVINTPNRGLGQKFEEQLLEHWLLEPLLTYHALIEHIIQQGGIPPAKVSAIEEFLALFKQFDQLSKPSTALNHIIMQTQYFTYLKKHHEDDDADTRIENVKELLRATRHFEDNGITSIEQFLHEVALMQEHINADKQKDDYVQLMTIHAAKGLEFDTVVLTGLEDGSFPSTHSIYEKDKLEEERRLFYVGITRAQERILLTTARYRMSYGQMNDQMPSRFLREIPENLAQSFDASQCSKTDIQNYFASWWQEKKSKVESFNTSVPKSPVILSEDRAKSRYESKDTRVSHTSKSSIKKSDPTKTVVSSGAWKKNQPVKHKKYGIGVIKDIITKNGDCYLSVQFKSELKKIKESFIEKV